jgi:hypothetical protein
VELSFDHLNAGDGVVLELLHTSEELRPKVTGSIIGGSRSGKVTDLGPVTEPFPLPRDTEEAKAGRHLWIFELVRQRVRVPRFSVLGWTVFLAIDAALAIVIVRNLPASSIPEEIQYYPFVAKVAAYMVVLPAFLGFLALLSSTMEPPSTTKRKLWGRRRRFPKALDVWKGI